ncbi:hypothetical protein Tsubulata_024587, partial [Turnera subulata]
NKNRTEGVVYQPQPFTLVTNCKKTTRGTDHSIINCVGRLQDPLFYQSDKKRFDLGFLPCFRRGKGGRGRRAHIRVAASSNDLLLCHSTHPIDLKERVYYLCNPLTRKWVAVPPFPETYPTFTKDVAVGLAVLSHDDSISYRVVRTHDGSGDCLFVAEVFSSETNTWVSMEVPDPPNYSPYYDAYGGRFNMFSWNGILFLPTYNCIIAYNPLEPERCHVIDTPPDEEGKTIHYEILGVFRGSLRLLQQHNDNQYDESDRLFLRMWELKDYEKGEWSFEYNLFYDEFDTDDAPLLDQLEGPWTDMKLLGLDPNDEGIVYFLHSYTVYERSQPCSQPWRFKRYNQRPPYCSMNRIFSCHLHTREVKLLESNKIPENERYQSGLHKFLQCLHQASINYPSQDRSTFPPIAR